jgi:aspartate aminotransferase
MIASKRVIAFQNASAPFLRFNYESSWARRRAEPGIADFVFGNPHDMPLPAFVESLQRSAVPQSEDWFAYKMSEPTPQATVAESLRQLRGMPFEASDIMMTTGAFSGISVALSTLVEPGEEVIFNSPPWFFYEGLIAVIDAVPVRVRVRADNFDLDLDAIQRAITTKTRAIIVNSPNNPTGKIYPEGTLKALADILDKASQRNGRTIYLLSDEAYSHILFDNNLYPSPTAYYPNTILIYTYGKVLLTPGQRIGYLALPPTMPDRAVIAQALFAAQIFAGWAFPNAILQYSLPELDKLSIDIDHLQRKRDRLFGALTEMGYELHCPQGTFYLLVKSPLADDWAFSELLADNNIFCLPGVIFELPGYFRLSLTANDEMIDAALPGFEAAIQAARQRNG